jgi:Fe-S-cluster-containing dehydrogenase component
VLMDEKSCVKCRNCSWQCATIQHLLKLLLIHDGGET